MDLLVFFMKTVNHFATSDISRHLSPALLQAEKMTAASSISSTSSSTATAPTGPASAPVPPSGGLVLNLHQSLLTMSSLTSPLSQLPLVRTPHICSVNQITRALSFSQLLIVRGSVLCAHVSRSAWRWISGSWNNCAKWPSIAAS